MIPQALFTPQTVAVIGSTSSGKLGAILLQQIMDGSFQGKLFAINPKAQGYADVQGCARLQDTNTKIDLAVIASPPGTVASVLEECGQCSVKAAIIITAGFKEIGNQAGEDEILAIAKRFSIRIIGPNCAGLCNTHHRFFPTLEVQPPAGQVGLISQSGAIAGLILAGAAQQGLGISKFVNYGNGSDLSVIDFLDYFREDNETSVVAVYIESAPDGRAFMNALAACCAKKPVLIIKSGRTNVGKRATASHTGSLAGADAVYDAAIEQAGAMRVKSVDELLNVSNALVSLPAVKGKRTLIVTNSGGPGVLTADAAEALGLQLNEPSEKVKAKLQAFLPAQCSLRNPIDLTVEGNREGYQRTIEAAENEYDAVIAVNITTPYLNADDLARGVATAQKNSSVPILTHFGPQQFVCSSVQILGDQAIPNFNSGEQAASVLAMVYTYWNKKQQNSVRKWPLWKNEGTPAFPKGPVLEPQAMQWLAENEIPVPRNRYCEDEFAVKDACLEIGFPLVMKVVSPQILHKSDAGGVIVNIKDEDTAARAFYTLRERAEGKDFRGVMVYPMLNDFQEVLVGLTIDPQFGPVVAFGLGGIYTEVLQDIVLRVAPLNHADAIQMIHCIKGINILKGYRGQAPCDLSALANLLVKFSNLPFEYADLAEIDLNPVFLFEKGLMVGDVRIIQS
ncbi:MAG: acetate--CoA ligase family protein [Anaerolineaceae bacterium]|nr:acetate--CoA ligase family protein [Anaerolineaceae bacterium]